MLKHFQHKYHSLTRISYKYCRLSTRSNVLYNFKHNLLIEFEYTINLSAYLVETIIALT